MKRTALLLASCLALVACDKVNQENFARLETGMPRAEVEALLGKPDECSGAMAFTSCTWGDEQRYISIQFASDRVLVFSARGLR